MVMDSRSRKPLQRALMGAAAIKRIYVTEHSYIDSANPDTNFGHPSLATVYKFFDGASFTAEKKGILKFASVPPLVVLQSDLATTILHFGKIIKYAFLAEDGSGINALQFNFQSILEDFDASAITWNNVGALSVGSASGIRQFDMNNTPSESKAGTFLSTAGTSLIAYLSKSDIFNAIFTGSTYGLIVKWFWITYGGKDSSIDFDLERAGLSPEAPTKYQSFIEWEV